MLYYHVYEAKFTGPLPLHSKDTCPKKIEKKQQNKAHLGTSAQLSPGSLYHTKRGAWES